MAIWTPNFSEDEQPSISSAVYQALGAASLCWEDMSSTGIFQSDEATEIADGLLRFLREHNSDAKFWEERWREAADQREQMQVERDAARAEVERLRSPEWEAEVRADERRRIADAIDARYQDIKGQPGHERNPEYWDGVLDGLDVAEQIVEKEAQS